MSNSDYNCVLLYKIITYQIIKINSISKRNTDFYDLTFFHSVILEKAILFCLLLQKIRYSVCILVRNCRLIHY